MPKEKGVYTKNGVSFIIPKKEAEQLAPKNELLSEQQRQEAEVKAQEMLAQQQLQEAQAAELASLQNKDFTQLGQTVAQQGGETTATQPALTPEQFNANFQAQTPLQKIGGLLSGRTFAEGAAARGGEVAAGSLPVGIAPATFSFAPIITKAKGAIASLNGVKLAAGAAGVGSIGTIYGLITGGRENRIKGDINDMVSTSTTLARGVGQGASPTETRELLVEMENSIKDKIAELNVASNYNVKNKITGADTQDYARKQLTKIMLNRQAVERYMLDGDINQLNLVLGTIDLE